jgi:hypothetical protein
LPPPAAEAGVPWAWAPSLLTRRPGGRSRHRDPSRHATLRGGLFGAVKARAPDREVVRGEGRVCPSHTRPSRRRDRSPPRARALSAHPGCEVAAGARHVACQARARRSGPSASAAPGAGLVELVAVSELGLREPAWRLPPRGEMEPSGGGALAARRDVMDDAAVGESRASTRVLQAP